eukprot:550758_1
MDITPLLDREPRKNSNTRSARQICLPVIIALLLSSVAIAVSIWLVIQITYHDQSDYLNYVFALLLSWSFILLIFNLIEGYKVRLLTHYYIPSKHMNKSYLFTSLPLLMYFVIFVLLLSLDRNRDYSLENILA